VISFDPSSLTSAESKAWYDQGYRQGLHFADKFHEQVSKDRTPTSEEIARAVKQELEDRQTAILAAAQSGGRNSQSLILALGRRAGFKDGLATHQIAVPADAEGETVTLDEVLAAMNKVDAASASSRPGEGQPQRPDEEPSRSPSGKEPSGGMSGVVWLFIIVFAGGWMGLVAYLFARRRGKVIQCPTCGNEHLQIAAVCPHCGHEQETQESSKPI
jgi:hypothetical protein